jgi:hypothetical protein
MHNKSYIYYGSHTFNFISSQQKSQDPLPQERRIGQTHLMTHFLEQLIFAAETPSSTLQKKVSDFPDWGRVNR